MKSHEKLSDALSAITAAYGKDILLDPEKVGQFLTDFFPKGKGERHIFKAALGAGIAAKITDARGKDETEQRSVMSQSVQRLADEYMLAKPGVEDVLWAYAEALGYKRTTQKQLAEKYYKNGEYSKAFPVYSALAQAGDADAQFRLAWMYDEGKGTKANPEAALEWMKKAAAQGHAEAQEELDDYYSDTDDD